MRPASYDGSDFSGDVALRQLATSTSCPSTTGCSPGTTPARLARARDPRAGAAPGLAGPADLADSLTVDDEADLRSQHAVVQEVARRVEAEHGAAAVPTNVAFYQDSKHLQVHVSSGSALRS